ncbi:MAG: arylamine N-acetyltransferase family protein [Solirubrobacteraceae bacterium]
MLEAGTDGEAVDGTAAAGGSPRPEAGRSRARLAARGVGVSDYLARIGASDVGPPSAAALAHLQARHLESVVFENLEIQRGRPTTVDAGESAERIVKSGRGGYCFHLNGAFGLLLEALGYEVSCRRGTVQPPPETAPGRVLNHLVVLVHGLPTSANPEGTWWAEVGFGDGSTRPLALRAGSAEDAPHTYVLEPSPVYAGGWRMLQEEGDGDGVGIIDVDTQPPQEAELAAAHERLATSPESRFVRTVTCQRRDARGVDILRARTLSRVERGSTRTTLLADEGEWFAALADVFGMPLVDVDAAERRALWQRVCAQHEAWAASSPG